MAIITEGSAHIALEGARKSRGNLTKARIRWVILGLVMIFAIVAGRLVQLGSVTVDSTIEGQTRDAIQASRPPILDRNGMELAVDIRVPSLFAEPRRIIDVDDAVEKLVQVLPDLNRDWLRKRLEGDKGFVWIKRELTPALQERIMGLGIPGLDFLTESKRFYPGGPDASHILGAVNVDNQGIAGIERYMDTEDVALLQSLGLARGQELAPVKLSIDLRVQHIMRAQLVDALTRYKAIAAAGVIIDVHTGEVIALSSLPDFDPNDPASMLVKGSMNRITAGKFELGSTFKTMTLAAALDSGKVKITDSFDARFGIRYGRFTIDDFHGQHRILTVPEIYKYSSNVGTIRVMQALGKDEYRAFITKMGFDAPLTLETPEKTMSDIPAKFSDIGAATASFGHGLSVTPMHMAAAMAAVVNGGNYVPPTFYHRTLDAAKALYKPVISPSTSAEMRYLLRYNGVEGSGSRPNKIANGYRIGAKTGTAEKVVNGRYDSNKNLNVFATVFPMDDPKYAVVILVDEPQAENAQSGRTAAFNAGDVTGRFIQQVAPMLGVAPNFDEALDASLVPPELR
jgi:cell division protein FtsI (penicillin-binding protein 3)